MSVKNKANSVIVVDDHAAVREGVKAYLAHRGVDVAGDAANSVGALEHLERHPDHVLILDLNMDGARGVSIIERCISQNPQARVVIYSMREALPTISTAYKAGAKAYVSKSADLDELVTAIDAAVNNEMYFMPGMAERIAQYHLAGESERSPPRVLTKQELGIFVRLAQGETNSAAAKALKISSRTIANHITSIRNKLGIGRADFTKLALQHGLIDIPTDV